MKIYCSGIGGIGLSAYASLMREAGHTVHGSDRSDSDLLKSLRERGIVVSLDQTGKEIPEDCDLFVYSEAIPASSPERTQATKLGIPQKSYPEALGDLSRGKEVIAVCGTHGKSSTTAMAARLLMQTGFDPTVVIGTKMQELEGRNWRTGDSDIFLLEACEYRRSSLHYDPSIILLTTCDGDHFDYYKDQEDYESAFIEFLARLPTEGVIITHGQDPLCRRVVQRSQRRMIDADAFSLIALKTPGKHMQQNAQLVLALAEHLGIPSAQAESILGGYAGSWRRMEIKGTLPGDILVIDDYGHHPREIAATITALKDAYPQRRLVCAFQPHTHDRTLKLYGDFLPAFRGVDALIVTDVYDARSDIEKESVDMPRFVADVEKASGVPVTAGGSLDHTEALLQSMLQPGDLLLTLGAGSITLLAERAVSKISHPTPSR